jgi:predicted GH43/DUF377 family glycosyl hydrolase
MKIEKNFIKVVLITFLIINGCSKENLVGINNSTLSKGSISLNLFKSDIPKGVQQINAELSRSNYDTLRTYIFVNNDSINVLSFESVPIGDWHLRVEARNSEGKTIYLGETNVTIIEDETIDVYLTLSSVGSGTGNINIYINWNNTWTDFQSNPFFTINDSPFPVLGVSQAQVIFDNGKYKMWYMNLYPAGAGDISYTESTDGINWINISKAPVLTVGEYGSWDDQAVGMGAIIKEDSLFKLYYIGMRGPYEKKEIGLAVSRDGIIWEKYPNPVLEATDNEYQLGTHAVIKINGKYYMYYESHPYNDYNKAAINLALSDDGIHWTRFNNNPILKPTEVWEGLGIGYASIVQGNDGLLMLFMNIYHSGFGLARSIDGINWTKDQNNPIFTVNKVSNNWCYKISYPYLVKVGNGYRIYYTGTNMSNTWALGFTAMKF